MNYTVKYVLSKLQIQK